MSYNENMEIIYGPVSWFSDQAKKERALSKVQTGRPLHKGQSHGNPPPKKLLYKLDKKYCV